MTRSERSTVGGIILGAGESSRFGSENKLLTPVDGTPVIRRVAGIALESPLDEVVTVLGHDADAVAEALGGLPVSTTYNGDYAAGQSSSLRCGIDLAHRSDWDAAVVLLGDMPFVNPTTIERLIEAYLSGAGSIVAPQCDGRRGNPVLFDRSLYERLCSVSGDRGGRELVATHPGTVRVHTDDRGVLRDVDTPRDLR
jgi:molybdenum cofactor cytidylyltransferase